MHDCAHTAGGTAPVQGRPPFGVDPLVVFEDLKLHVSVCVSGFEPAAEEFAAHTYHPRSRSSLRPSEHANVHDCNGDAYAHARTYALRMLFNVQ